MNIFITILTTIALCGLGGVIIWAIYLKEKENTEDEEEMIDDYRDEELNSIYDDYGKNDYI